MKPSSQTIQGLGLDPDAFEPRSVPATTRAVIERLRRAGSVAPALTTAGIEELRSAPQSEAGVLAVEPPSDLAVERVIEGPAEPLRLHVLRAGQVRASYLHVHGGGWALGGPDHQDQTLLRFARAARVAVIAVDYRLTPEHPHPAGLADCVAAIRWIARHGERELGAQGSSSAVSPPAPISRPSHCSCSATTARSQR